MTKILVIDDDSMLREVIVDILVDLGGYEVVQEANGKLGVKTAKAVIPDLIICDIEMPELNGYEVITQLQKDSTTSTIPFVFLTGKKDPHSNRKGMILGADDYITKPFQSDELLKAIEARIAKSQTLTSHYDQKMASLRESILYALPHEIRTPLTGIIGMAILLSQEADPLPHTEVVEYASTILESGYRLQSLLENYLYYVELDLISADPSRLEVVQNKCELDPDQLITSSVLEVAKNYDLPINFDLSVQGETVLISPDHLQKIVSELSDNAFKFSPQKRPITVKTEIKQAKFALTIINEGRGMAPAEIQEIGSFRQFERKNHEQQGLGLGLIIVHKIINLHGGSISINSLQNQYTTIQVLLPLAAPPPDSQ